MKSNIFKTMAVAVTAIFAGYNVYLAQAKTNAISADILMANVEALASGEGGEAVITCSAKCSDGVGACWVESRGGVCVFSGSMLDSCTGLPCKTSTDIE